jgi:hypothetical protein
MSQLLVWAVEIGINYFSVPFKLSLAFQFALTIAIPSLPKNTIVLLGLSSSLLTYKSYVHHRHLSFFLQE